LIETSAKTGENIEEVFRKITENLLSSKDKSISTSRVDSNVIDLNETNNNDNNKKKKKGCC
jgi:hypothetical protein